jgi:hypothetical protein
MQPKSNGALAVITVLGISLRASATDIPANPSNYATLLGTLKSGDTLRLEPGDYKRLNISNLNGTETLPVIITGPESGPAAVFHSDPGPCCNTVEIINSSYVVIRRITINGDNVAGAAGISAKDGSSNRVHDITVEGCTLIRLDAQQQTVGISTKTPTWGWVVRGNRISGAGTGAYLGNSDGSQPFVGGLIEGNLFENTVGYNMEIKFQNPAPRMRDCRQHRARR